MIQHDLQHSGRTGSNRQHSAWKADALPIELRPHCKCFIYKNLQTRADRILYAVLEKYKLLNTLTSDHDRIPIYRPSQQVKAEKPSRMLYEIRSTPQTLPNTTTLIFKPSAYVYILQKYAYFMQSPQHSLPMGSTGLFVACLR